MLIFPKTNIVYQWFEGLQPYKNYFNDFILRGWETIIKVETVLRNFIDILTNAGWRFPSFENGSTVRGANTKFSSVRSKCKLSLYTFIQSRFCQSCRSNSTNIWNEKWSLFNELFVNLREHTSLELQTFYQIIWLNKNSLSWYISTDHVI